MILPQDHRVLVHIHLDRHQDHQAAHQEVLQQEAAQEEINNKLEPYTL
jgi:hypothetical protein